MGKVAWQGVREGKRRVIEDFEGKFENCQHPVQFVIQKKDEVRQVCKGCKRDLFVRLEKSA